MQRRPYPDDRVVALLQMERGDLQSSQRDVNHITFRRATKTDSGIFSRNCGSQETVE